MKETSRTCYDILIIGGGPAGTGLLMKALKDGTRSNFFNTRVAVVERSSQLIAGNITEYRVNSDTLSDVFLECLEGATSSVIDVSKLSEEVEFMRSYKGKSIPLPELKSYFKKLGELLLETLSASRKCEFLMNTTLEKVIQNIDGTYSVFLSGKSEPISTKQIVVATGGVPKTLPIENENFANAISLDQYKEKIVHSDRVLKFGLEDEMKLKLKNHPKVVILGGSHSAFSVAHYLLNGNEDIPFNSADIQIWATNIPKIYFNNKEEAHANGYYDFGEAEFCPITRKLYRLAGLRMDGRELYMRMLGLGETEREKRVVHNVYTDQMVEIKKQLDTASVVISAYGYRLNMIPFYDANGIEIYFEGAKTNHWVNDNCELLDENGNVVPNVFATGLATGFIPNGELGGEPSFRGQTNGIWYYQNAIADLIMRNMGLASA